jgi:hypothetical protein
LAGAFLSPGGSGVSSQFAGSARGESYFGRSEILTAVLLEKKALWDIMLCHWEVFPDVLRDH